jgi:hypothetical protein
LHSTLVFVLLRHRSLCGVGLGCACMPAWAGMQLWRRGARPAARRPSVRPALGVAEGVCVISGAHACGARAKVGRAGMGACLGGHDPDFGGGACVTDRVGARSNECR